MTAKAAALDVLMGADGDLPAYTRHASGMEVIAQRVRTRLGTHRGDWPLDTSKGIAWTSYLGRKPLDLASLAAVLSLEILDTPGVADVQDLDWEQDGGTYTITATVLTELGESLPVVVVPQDSAGNPSVTVGGVLGHSGTVAP